MPISPKQNLYLIGPMGVGKTALGKRLASAMNRRFIDSDQALEKSLGVTITDIFDIEGEAGFRQREHTALKAISEQGEQVVATGGGVVMRDDNCVLMRETGVVAYLKAPLNVLWSRLKYCSNRPLLQTDNPKQVLAALLAEREPSYQQAADVVIELGNLPAAKTTELILQQLKACEIT